jgi:hypothetical protein
MGQPKNYKKKMSEWTNELVSAIYQTRKLWEQVFKTPGLGKKDGEDL